MNSYPKFMFDYDLDPSLPEPEIVADGDDKGHEEPVEPEIVIPTYSEEQIKESRNEGFDEGKELGINEAAEAMECKINEALGHMSEHFEDMFRKQKQANAEVFQDAIDVAVGLVKKCFPGLNERTGVNEIEIMMTELLSQIIDEPRVQVHIHPDLIDPLQQRIDGIAADTHFEGRIVLLGDDEIQPGDCRIEWQDGGGERNMQDLWMQVDGIVARTFQSSPKREPMPVSATTKSTINEQQTAPENIVENATENEPEPELQAAEPEPEPEPIIDQSSDNNAVDETDEQAPAIHDSETEIIDDNVPKTSADEEQQSDDNVADVADNTDTDTEDADTEINADIDNNDLSPQG